MAIEGVEGGGEETAVLSALVTRLRRMTGADFDEYTIGEETFWSDEQFQAVLAANVCERLTQRPVDLLPSIDESGSLVTLAGSAQVAGALDPESATVVTYGGEAMEGVTVHEDGRVDFTEDATSASPLISGLAYDLNRAAADVFTAWASAVKLGYDISTGGSSLSRSQRHDMLMEQAKDSRSRGVVTSARLTRDDVSGSPRSRSLLRSFGHWGRR